MLWNSKLLPTQEKEGILHEASSAPFSFIVKRHATSLEVLDTPDPVAFGDEFKIKVGVRCSAECKLTRKEVAIYDHAGTKVATGTLGDAPWSAAGALYWAEADLEAPATEGSYEWNVKLPKPDLELAHEGSAYPFAFVTATPPDHVVTVEVIDKHSKTPLSKAFVTLYSSGGFPYRNRTDDAGVARVSVPKGEYKIYVLKEGYKAFQTTAAIASDVAIKAELLFAPDLGG